MGIIECISGSIIFWGKGTGSKVIGSASKCWQVPFSCKNGVHNFGSPQLSSQKKKIRKGKKVNSLRIFILLFPPSLLECYQYLEALLTFFDQTGARGIQWRRGFQLLTRSIAILLSAYFEKKFEIFFPFRAFRKSLRDFWLFKDPFNKYKGATERSVELMH